MSTNVAVRIVPILTLLMASGCTHFREWRNSGKVGPDYCPPTVTISPEWTEYNSPSVIAAQNAVVDDSWWEVFGDPEIQRFVGCANSGNLPLKAAMHRAYEQCLLRNIAVGNLFPQQQQAFAEYSRFQFSENGNPFGIPGFGQTFSLYEVGFNAGWEIDLWGRLRRIIESADAELQASAEDVHDVRLCLTADVVASYTQIRVLQQRIRIARDQVAAQQETLRIAETRFKNGSATKLDVSQATAIVESTRASIPVLEYELRMSNNQLCLLLGIPTTVLFDENNIGEIPFAPEQVVLGTPYDLLRRRPDIRQAERKVAAQSAKIGVAAAELFPALALKGTISLQSFEPSSLFESASVAGAIVPGVRWNILNYGRLKNQVAVEQNRLEQAIIGYRQTVLKAGTELEDALTTFTKKKEEIAAVQRAVEATRESLEIATKQYREGDIDLDRVNNLRKDLITQLDLDVAARGHAVLGLIRVYKSMGGGWTLNGESFDYGPSPSYGSTTEEWPTETSQAISGPAPTPTGDAPVESGLRPQHVLPSGPKLEPPTQATKSLFGPLPTTRPVEHQAGHSPTSNGGGPTMPATSATPSARRANSVSFLPLKTNNRSSTRHSYIPLTAIVPAPVRHSPKSQ